MFFLYGNTTQLNYIQTDNWNKPAGSVDTIGRSECDGGGIGDRGDLGTGSGSINSGNIGEGDIAWIVTILLNI